jgi:hypothetical protein
LHDVAQFDLRGCPADGRGAGQRRLVNIGITVLLAAAAAAFAVPLL